MFYATSAPTLWNGTMNEYLLLTKIAYFLISELWTFGLQNLFVRTREPFFSNLGTFGLKNLRTREPSNLRTFGLIGCNHQYTGLRWRWHYGQWTVVALVFIEYLKPQSHRAYDQVTTYLRPKNVGIGGKS